MISNKTLGQKNRPISLNTIGQVSGNTGKMEGHESIEFSADQTSHLLQ